MELIHLGAGNAKVRFPIDINILLVLNSENVMNGGDLFKLADIAAAYATMTILEKEYVPLTARAWIVFHQPVVKNEVAIFANAVVYDDQERIDRKGHLQRTVKTRVIINNNAGAVKAKCTVHFSILHQTIAEKIIQKIAARAKKDM